MSRAYTTNYTTNERGHRVFMAGGVPHRAFWATLGHRWIVISEIDGFSGRREFRNWREVETWVDRLGR